MVPDTGTLCAVTPPVGAARAGRPEPRSPAPVDGPATMSWERPAIRMRCIVQPTLVRGTAMTGTGEGVASTSTPARMQAALAAAWS